MTKPPAARALRAIIAYKAVKACVQLGFAVALLALWPFGLPLWIQGAALELRRHATHGWAVHGSGWLVGHSTARGIELTMLALGADGALTALEAWALAAKRAWGPWLVVGASATLLPFEIYELVRVPRPSRVLIVVVNLAIAGYLARRAWLEHSARSADSRITPD
jgi:uncharacterized membrane protein (DUF2068 family)